jgi:hypothetical protein
VEVQVGLRGELAVLELLQGAGVHGNGMAFKVFSGAGDVEPGSSLHQALEGVNNLLLLAPPRLPDGAHDLFRAYGLGRGRQVVVHGGDALHGLLEHG